MYVFAFFAEVIIDCPRIVENVKYKNFAEDSNLLSVTRELCKPKNEHVFS